LMCCCWPRWASQEIEWIFYLISFFF
jgi:hypothetical protein